MHSWLAEMLVDPLSGGSLTIEADTSTDDRIESGALVSLDGRRFPIRNGIPRFVDAHDPGEAQVAESFGFKWGRGRSYEAPRFKAWYETWLLTKYGFGDASAASAHFQSFATVLEVGCGVGLSSAITLSGENPDQRWVGLDISSAIDVARERLGEPDSRGFVQGDALRLPFGDGTFQAIFSEGVLHHTPSTEAAVRSLIRALAPGGELMFYVYRKKGPIREFADDYIRGRLADLPPDEAWRQTGQLTDLARRLSEMHASIDVPEDIPLLGIRAGRHDVQRLIYWTFAKLYWNDEFGFDGSNLVNFDWYHPQFAHRHTEDEVRSWCEEGDLTMIHFDAQESGFTVRARKG